VSPVKYELGFYIPEDSILFISALILFTHDDEAIRSSETSVLTRTTRRHIPEDGIQLYMYNHA
jgi:hypothetical protein